MGDTAEGYETAFMTRGASARIESVRACTVRIPLDTPTSFATRQVTARDYALVQVRTSDGVEGIGFCYGGSSAGGLVTKAVRELFQPMLVGQDPYRVEGLWQEMYQEAILHGRTGAVMRAISIIDVALWDRNARTAGLPLHRYLGSYADDRVPAYASGGYYLDGKTPQMLGQEMASYVELGFKAVKMKVGRLDPNLLGRARPAECRDGFVRNGAKVQAFGGHGQNPRLDSGDIEQVVHQIAQPVRLLVDDLEQLPGLHVVQGALTSQRRRCRAFDGRQRRLQLVTHHAEKLAPEPLHLLQWGDVLNDSYGGGDGPVR